MDVRGQYFLSREEAHFISPPGWDFDIYSYQPKKFAFSKTSIQLGEHIDVVRYNFLSRIRFRAIMKRPKLQFDFIDSYSSESSRLQSVNGVDSILMISLGGSHWEGVSDIGALGIELNFDEYLTSRILAPDDDILFGQRIKTLIGGQSLILPLDPTLLKMKAMLERYLHHVEHVRNESNPTSLAHDIPRTDYRAHEVAFKASEFSALGSPDDVLAEMARNTLMSWCSSLEPRQAQPLHRRREIALNLEKILWRSPLSRESDQDYSLDEFADYFHVSRRTVQLAVQEHFGIGFTALRRMIRLHQLRHALIHRPNPTRITSLINEFYLGHMGRASRDYADLFGVKPSVDRNDLQQLDWLKTRMFESQFLGKMDYSLA